ncbi:hypothetical protein OKW23_001434 [Bacilli bacterium PM5-9]|nr:hypothetical protein [Bacilli bacterium PM5-9]
MKCLICKKAFLIDSLDQIFSSQQLCNKCRKLFIYNKKNVKIREILIRVFFCRYYNVISYYNDINKCVNFNQFVFEKYIKREKFYDLETIKKSNEFIDEKQIIIVFERSDFQELIYYLNKLNKSNKRMKVKAFEIMAINTKKTQTKAM